MEGLQKGYNNLIYTIGSDENRVDDFIEMLHNYRIGFVVDVRRFPKSRFPYFTKEALKEILEKEGIGYEWFGERLGGYRRGGYRAYMSTQGFMDGINDIDRMAKRRRICLLCSERFPWRCHRIFIANALMERGWEVLHIIDKERTWRPKGNGE